MKNDVPVLCSSWIGLSLIFCGKGTPSYLFWLKCDLFVDIWPKCDFCCWFLIQKWPLLSVFRLLLIFDPKWPLSLVSSTKRASFVDSWGKSGLWVLKEAFLLAFDLRVTSVVSFWYQNDNLMDFWSKRDKKSPKRHSEPHFDTEPKLWRHFDSDIQIKLSINTQRIHWTTF